MEPDQAHVLIVDDSQVIRNALAQRLQKLGHRTSLAENGRQALDMMRAQPFDLALLDMTMPEMNGYEVLKHLRAEPALRHVPVIVISAQEDIESVVQCIELGAQDYLVKPFNPVLLQARVGACLEKKRLRDLEVEHLARLKKEKERSEKLLHVVIPIGVALPAEKDFDRLLETIVLQAQSLCNADAGTLYLRTEDNRLEFVILRNTPLKIALGGTTGQAIPFPPVLLYDPITGEPNSHDITAQAALSGVSINIPDAYHSEEFDLSSAQEFDRKTGYRSQSFLTIPLKSNARQVIGVLQLVNAREPATGEIVLFDEYLQQMIESLSLLATAALEMYIREHSLRQQIEQLRIEIDEAQQSRRVAEITETEYFQQLLKKARDIRKQTEDADPIQGSLQARIRAQP